MSSVEPYRFIILMANDAEIMIQVHIRNVCKYYKELIRILVPIVIKTILIKTG